MGLKIARGGFSQGARKLVKRTFIVKPKKYYINRCGGVRPNIKIAWRTLTVEPKNNKYIKEQNGLKEKLIQLIVCFFPSFLPCVS